MSRPSGITGSRIDFAPPMILYELRHLFFTQLGHAAHSPKTLGMFTSSEHVRDAIAYYLTQPGFRDDPEAFSVRTRNVSGELSEDAVFEAGVYLHSEDYDYEYVVELGLYGDEHEADSRVREYCKSNPSLVHSGRVVVEEFVQKHWLNRREWAEGFLID